MFILVFEVGDELYWSKFGDVLGDTGCLIEEFFDEVDEGDFMDKFEFFGDEVYVIGDVLLFSWLEL